MWKQLKTLIKAFMKLVDISVDNWENLLTLSTVFCVMLFINCLSTEITQLIHRNCR